MASQNRPEASSVHRPSGLSNRSIPSKAHTKRSIIPIRIPFCGWPYGASLGIGRRSADCACFNPKAPPPPTPRTLLPRTPAACYAPYIKGSDPPHCPMSLGLATPGPYKAHRLACTYLGQVRKHSTSQNHLPIPEKRIYLHKSARRITNYGIRRYLHWLGHRRIDHTEYFVDQ